MFEKIKSTFKLQLQNHRLIVLLIFYKLVCVCLFSACLPIEDSLSPEEVLVPKPSESTAAENIAGATDLLFTLTPLPTITSLASSTPTGTKIEQISTPTRTVTATTSSDLSVSTLAHSLEPTAMSVEEKGMIFQQLTQNQAPCQLSYVCWWGMMPGSSNMMDVKNFLEDLGFKENIAWEETNLGAMGRSEIFEIFGFYDPDFKFLFPTVGTYFRGGDKLDLIRVVLNRPRSVYPNAQMQFDQDWEIYLPQTIMDVLGPTEFAIIRNINLSEPPPIYIALFSYPESGFQISYTFSEKEGSDPHQVCLNYEDLSDIEIIFYDREQINLIPDKDLLVLELPEDSENLSQYTWEAQTGFTFENIYSQNSNNVAETCVTIN